MSRPLIIAIEPTKIVPAAAEVTLLKAALDKNPDSLPVRMKLGNVLNELDRFEETTALLRPLLEELDSNASRTLTRAAFAVGDAQLANDAAGRAVTTARNDNQLANALAEQAKVCLRADKEHDAVAILREALQLDCANVTAFKRLVVHLLRQGQFAEVDRLTQDMIAADICHSRVLAARTLALAALGRDDEAWSTAGIERFLHRIPGITMSVSGRSDAEDFNAALADELSRNVAIRRNRFGTASLQTDRLDSPLAGSTPLWSELLQNIATQIENWAGSLDADGHPWLSSLPERAILRSWCVITGAEGHEGWHMHPDGWLSGGYYPLVPPNDGGKDGNIAFGIPDGLPGADAAKRFGEVSLMPTMGELLLFPSHVYHHTYPHGTDARRICVAFDIVPA